MSPHFSLLNLKQISGLIFKVFALPLSSIDQRIINQKTTQQPWGKKENIRLVHLQKLKNK